MTPQAAVGEARRNRNRAIAPTTYASMSTRRVAPSPRKPYYYTVVQFMLSIVSEAWSRGRPVSLPRLRDALLKRFGTSPRYLDMSNQDRVREDQFRKTHLSAVSERKKFNEWAVRNLMPWGYSQRASTIGQHIPVGWEALVRDNIDSIMADVT
eukprot:GHVU01033539.1.p1 GENE.GHVU01033539.1~~GHVU01033539.1.p1  ORF type:complete len:153 (-),score=7.24 GHVU01033539.1:200-658(-)